MIGGQFLEFKVPQPLSQCICLDLQTQGYVSCYCCCCYCCYSSYVTNLQNRDRINLKSEIMDGFWSSRCLNDRIDLPDKIGLFLSGAATSIVVKNGTKKNFSPKNTKNDKNSYKGSSNKKKLENRPPQKWAF